MCAMSYREGVRFLTCQLACNRCDRLANSSLWFAEELNLLFAGPALETWTVPLHADLRTTNSTKLMITTLRLSVMIVGGPLHNFN